MYKIGVFPLRAMPLHRGHINSIIHAATKAETLYVVLCDNPERTREECVAAGLPVMDAKMRLKWLGIELQGFNHIKTVLLDESDVPRYPFGWEKWSDKLNKLIPHKIDVIFGGEPSYTEGYQKWYPETVYELFDYKRERYPVSGTEVRSHPFRHWEYIPGAARPFFTKKFLNTGTESCGKTTITKYLAKIYYTSWSEELGRYYSARNFGGREDVYSVEDFERIVVLQDEQDKEAIRTANKITFFDSDAVVTQYYLEMYLGVKSSLIDTYIEKYRKEKKFDYILFYEPDVKWVDDGLRFLGEQEVREKNSKKLLEMYKNYGFDNIYIINGNYEERLEKTINFVDRILE